jgi:hypothetical protein
MDPSKILKNLLTFQNQMKLYHWQTKSFARHTASDKLVEKAMDITDRIIESYQGSHGKIILNDSNKTLELDNITDDNIVAYLNKMKAFLNTDFEQILDEAKNGDVFNLRDEMLENIDITLYLFGLDWEDSDVSEE